MPDQMPPNHPPSPEGDVAALVEGVAQGLAKLTEALQDVSPDAGARMADVTNAFMETVSSLQSEAEAPAEEPQEKPVPMRGQSPQGPRGVPVP